MRVLITGGAGFIGSQLGFHLRGKGHDVRLVDNLRYGYVDNLVEEGVPFDKFVCMDVRDAGLERLMDGVEVVFHFAGISSLPECSYNAGEAISINVGGTANVLELARRQGVRKIVFSSTGSVYENDTAFPSRESSNPQPTLVYSRSKLSAEELCHGFTAMYGQDITILRFFNVYGPHMDYLRPNPPLVSYIVKCLLDGVRPVLHSTGDQERDMVYVSDVVRMCEIVMMHPRARNETFNVGSGKTYTVKQVYRQAAEAFGRPDVEPVFRDAALLWEKYKGLFSGQYPLKAEILEAEVNKYTLAATEKSRDLLGWSANVDLAEGIADTVAFAKRNAEHRNASVSSARL